MLFEQVIIYSVVALLCVGIVYFYLRKLKKLSNITAAKVEEAKATGLFQPVSLHPEIDLNKCIKSGACIAACPEKDIIGIVDGKATLINASNCIGHGACFHSCPVEAISLRIGTEERGVDLPHVNQQYETNMPGIYIAGELGGMGLIKNSVEQGQNAVDNMVKAGFEKDDSSLDLVIIGAGPAGVSASLMAKKHGLNYITLEQDTLGGTVFTFPRSKVVMTAPMNLPLFGKVKLFDTSKSELLGLWNQALSKNKITIKEKTKVEEILPENGIFRIKTQKGEEFLTKKVLLAIGRRGSPRKLGVPGETLEKVAYRLLEPENISGKDVIVVGGGDSAIEAALSLTAENKVVLSYRSEKFNRIKPKNRDKLNQAIEAGVIDIKYKTNVAEIKQEEVVLVHGDSNERETIKNDLIFIFAGGELPTQFLQKSGVEITKRFGYTMKKHN
ncbi:MAG: NAD(P)-binding domain-containing protein [Saprospiraceae bacterium]|nr:NAD(P)-binding domain-containing protein [Saprospiraceae bacterium]